MREIPVTNVFERNRASLKPVIVNIGGARSSKTYSITQLLLERATAHHGRHIGITRKTMASQHNSVYKNFIEQLKSYGVYNVENHDKSHHTYTFPNADGDSRFTFFGLDEPERMKSTEFNDVWMEEGNEFTYEDFLFLKTRLSGQTMPNMTNKILVSLNPDSPEGWIAKKLIPDPTVEVIHSTYKDNPFLNPEYIAMLENLKEQDENAWRVFCLGEFGVSGGHIYQKYELVDALPDSPDETIYGLDFGYNNPMALVQVDFKDKALFVDELLYETGLSTSARITRIEAMIPTDKRNCAIYADSADPASIEEIQQAGFNIYPSDKDVLIGISTVKSQKLNITKRSDNLIREIQGYKWRKDKNNKTLDEPVKFNDHALDALRYAVRTHLKPRVSPEVTIL